MHYKMLFAVSLNLDQSKILLTGNRFKQSFDITKCTHKTKQKKKEVIIQSKRNADNFIILGE